MKRRNLTETQALHMALTLAAAELEANQCGEQVEQAIALAGGSDHDADAVRRKLLTLAAQLRGRAANLLPRPW